MPAPSALFFSLATGAERTRVCKNAFTHLMKAMKDIPDLVPLTKDLTGPGIALTNATLFTMVEAHDQPTCLEAFKLFITDLTAGGIAGGERREDG